MAGSRTRRNPGRSGAVNAARHTNINPVKAKNASSQTAWLDR